MRELAPAIVGQTVVNPHSRAEFGGIVARTEIAVPGPERMAHHRDWVLDEVAPCCVKCSDQLGACLNAEKLAEQRWLCTIGYVR